jgi:peptide/nickel transport system substrate-binding protein
MASAGNWLTCRLTSVTGRRILFSATATIAALTILAPDASAQVPRRGGKLVIARSADITVWDPKYTNDTLTIQAQHQIYANLLESTPDGKSLQPSLAESYKISEDGRVYTFKLRSSAKFCDGSLVTADDVKFSFDRAMEKDSRVPWQFPNKPSVDVIDPATVRITLDKPNVAFSRYLTLWGTQVISKAYTERVGVQEMGLRPLGSGPFCMDRFVKGQVTTLKRNPGYWDPERPYLDEIELRYVQDENAAVLQLRSGQVDVALSVPFSQAESLKRAPGVTPSMVTLDATASIVPNLKTVPAVADAKVRQAMLMALDRQAIVDALLFGNGEPAQSPFYGPGVLYHTRDFGVPFDVNKAKKLMAESRFPNGFSAKLLIPSGDEIAGQAAVIVKDQLAKIGIGIDVQPTESGTWFSMWSGGNFELVYKLGSNLVGDPAQNMPFDFWSIEEGGRNAAYSGYRNEEIVKISKAAEGEMDLAKRAAMYREVQRIAMEEVPQIYLFHPSVVFATREEVKNFRIYPTRLVRLWEVWRTK